MRLQSLLSLSLSFAAVTGLVSGAPSTAPQQDQTVTIQRFPVKQVYGQTETETIQKLTAATSRFKAANGKKIEDVYFGVVPGTPDVAEQIFLWKSPADASLDTTKPFIPFSSTGSEFNRTTAVLNDKTTLLQALNSPITETIVEDISPQISTSQVNEDLSLLVTDIRNSGFGVGGSHGIKIDGSKRTLIVVNGWGSEQAPNNWIASQSTEIAAVFERFREYFVVVPTPLFKHLVEVA